MKSKKPIKRVVTEFVPPDDDDERIIELDDPSEETYSGFVNKFEKEGVVVKVYRQTAQGSKQYLYRGKPDEIDEEAVRLFHAKQPYARESATYYLTVMVNGEPRNSFPIEIGPQVGTPGSDVQSSGGMADHGLLRLLQEQNMRLETLLLSKAQREEREPIGALADAMLKLQQIQGAQKTEVPLDTIMKAVELGRELGGTASDDWKSWLLPVLKESMPMIQGMIGAAGAARQNPTVGSEAMTTNTNPQQTAINQLRTAIAFLKQKCLAGSDPGLYLDLIIDNRDGAQYQQLIREVLTRDFSEFATIDSDIAKPPFESYFRYLFDGLRSAFSPENTVDANPEGTPGNTPDVASNGATGKSSVKKS